MRRLSVLLSMTAVAAGSLLAAAPSAHADDLCYRVALGGHAVNPTSTGTQCVPYQYGAWCYYGDTYAWGDTVHVYTDFCWPAVV